MEAIIIVCIVCWAFRDVYRDVAGKVRTAREERISEIEKAQPAGTALPKGRRRRIAAQHDAAWTAREILTGFPVTRTAWHTAWLSHKAAAMQQRHLREEAKTTHAEVKASFADAISQHKARQKAAKAEIDNAVDEAPETPRTRKAVEAAAGNVLPFPGPKPADPEPPAQPQPGPYAPKADAPGKPAPAPHPAEPADWSEISRLPGGEWPTGVPHRRKNGTPPSATTEGARMPAGTTATAEFTYDQTQDHLTKEVIRQDARIQDIRLEMAQNHLEMVAAVVSDPDTLGALAEADEALQRELKAAQDRMESLQNAKAHLTRNHGGQNQAHQDAPIPVGADPTFYL